MDQPAAVKEALEALHDVRVGDRAAPRRRERSWQLARPIVDAAMLAVAFLAAAVGASSAGVTPPSTASRRACSDAASASSTSDSGTPVTRWSRDQSGSRPSTAAPARTRR